MSWYVLQCRPEQEEKILHACRNRLSPRALEEAFVFCCERLWKVDGVWKVVKKDMFPGYVFLQSSHPGTLSRELEEFRLIFNVMKEYGYLISVYEEEEKTLRKLCGQDHFLKMSYGYRDRERGVSLITEGPLFGMREKIIKIDWHRRFAQVELELARRRAVIWAGVGIAPEEQVS